MIRNSLICKLINDQASMKENNDKIMKNCDEISKLIKAFPKEQDYLLNGVCLGRTLHHGLGKKIKNSQSSGVPLFKTQKSC